MVILNTRYDINYDLIDLDEEWNDSEKSELTMHTIHAYPAKFPAFIASKAFEYAKKDGVIIHKVADIFCGCGTVALESKVHNYEFWGCDINPVATLIAKTKSYDYDIKKLEKYYNNIVKIAKTIFFGEDAYNNANERLKYWFTEKNYLDLLSLYQSIKIVVGEKKYKDAFCCIFSSILKTCSRWLTKSIKPQLDVQKKEMDVGLCFFKQYKKFLKAVKEISCGKCRVEVVCDNFLTCREIPKVDLVITSPPYVTSYEYADLHQLSSLWLQYTDDYRKLRKGSIGSIYNNNMELDLSGLNSTGKEIIDLLRLNNCPTTKIKSIARYYLDMQEAVTKISVMLNKGGMAFFVIGDTEYKGVRILNSKHLIEQLVESGFDDIKISKRTISKGICVPYRDCTGKFSRDKCQKQIYHEEFIISGRSH